jgi:hypothetical protein
MIITVNLRDSASPKFPMTVKIDPGTVIGVKDVVLPYCWNNVTEKNNSFWYNPNFRKKLPGHEKSDLEVIAEEDHLVLRSKINGVTLKMRKCEIETGQYDDAVDLIQSLNSTVAHLHGKIRFYYKPKLRKAYIAVRDDGVLVCPVTLTGLTSLLGFETEIFTSGVGVYRADYEVFANSAVNINILCDVIPPQVVGDKNLRVLKTVTVEKEVFGDIIERKSDEPEYYPVVKDELDSISLALVNDRGDHLEIDRGVISLHLKRNG